MFLIVLGILCFISVIVLLIIPAKNINEYYGFRTKFSLKNKIIWDDANNFFKYIEIVIGVFTVILGVTFYTFLGDNFKVLQFIIGILLMMSGLVVTEIYIRSKYKND